MIAPTDNMRSRYAVTLSTQLLQLVLSIATAGMVPRALGPVWFGNYNFLLNMANNIRAFIDLGSREAFFTFSSKLKHSGPVTKLYGIWLLAQLGISFLLAAGAFRWRKLAWIWPGQHLKDICLITLLEWLIFVALTLRQLGDSKGLTIRIQSMTAWAALLSTSGLLVLAILHHLTFYSYAGLFYMTTGASCAAYAFYLLIRHKSLCWSGSLKMHWRGYVHKWWVFASPLIVYGLYSALFNSVDSYVIQRLYGSTEQAVFALATRFSAFILVFTSSAVMIYWREIAAFLASGNLAGAAHIYARFNRLLFFLTILLCFWVSLNASHLVKILAGDAYQAAIPVLMIMAFYPLQQTFGQLDTVVFLAAERTAVYRDLGIAMSIPSLILSYFLLAPATFRISGLHLGATGIALRMVGYGLLCAQISHVLNCRFLQLDYREFLAERTGIVILLGGLAAALFIGVGKIWPVQSILDHFYIMSATSLLYFALAAMLLYFYPSLAGLQKSDIAFGIQFLKNRSFDSILRGGMLMVLKRKD